MAAPGSGAGVAGMQGRLVGQFQQRGGERGFKPGADTVDAGVGRGAHASSSLMYLDRNSICTKMKTKKMPVKPNSLKLTQAPVSALNTTKATNRFSRPIVARNAIHA